MSNWTTIAFRFLAGLTLSLALLACRTPTVPEPWQVKVAKDYTQAKLGSARKLEFQNMRHYDGYTAILLRTGNAPGDYVVVDVDDNGKVLRWNLGR